MRSVKILLLAVCAIALLCGAAGAGLNPQDPGLGGGVSVYNPNMSAVCTTCHSDTPAGAGVANRGTHFVVNGSRATNSGGGWTGALSGLRDGATGGQYFKLGSWGGGSYSKYGNATDNTNHYTPANNRTLNTVNWNDNVGMGVSEAAATTYGSYEIICESCHNVVHNVPGGNNLVAPMASATYAAGVGDNVQCYPVNTADEATLCVGCHGFMYSAGAIGSNPAYGTNVQTRWNDARNINDMLTPARRGNNESHYIYGTQYSTNHHVMTGDLISNLLAGNGQLFRDVLIVPPDMDGVTMNTATERGQMPVYKSTWTTWADQKSKDTTNTGRFSCLNCHSAPHTGYQSTGASIIRDTNAGGLATLPIDRLSEASRGGRYIREMNDIAYCNDCHQTK